MTFDFNKTLALIKGGVMDHEATWRNYLDENPGWQQTTMLLTGPLLIANVLLGQIFARMMGGYAAYGLQGNFFVALIWGLVLAAIGFLIAVFVFNFLAGTFKGKPDFNRTFAAVSLAAIPAWLAGMVSGLIPVLGLLLALAGGIMSLVFMYKIMPLAVEVPDEKRTLHFVLSLIVIVVLNMVIGFTLVGSSVRDQMRTGGYTSSNSSSRSTSGSGIVGAVERQGRLMEAAESDVFDPPADGELDEDQVETYISALKKTRALHQQYAQKMEKMAADMKAKQEAGETPSLSDLTNMYGGVGSAMIANNAEMEVVKTAGGNWAEHLWVKQQLRTAQVQQGEGSEQIERNYGLYQKYQNELVGGP